MLRYLKNNKNKQHEFHFLLGKPDQLQPFNVQPSQGLLIT